MRPRVSLAGLTLGVVALLAPAPAGAQGTIGPSPPQLNHPIPPGLVCTAEALNVSGFVGEDGRLAVANIPSSRGSFRVRVTCRDPLGNTFIGYSELVDPVPGGVIDIENVAFDGAVPVPASLVVTPSSVTLVGLGSTAQLAVDATFSGGGSQDLTAGSTGTTYNVSNPVVASVDPDGLVTGSATGTAVVTATNDGKVGFAVITVLSAPLVGLEVAPVSAVIIIDALFGGAPVGVQVTGLLGDGSRVDLTPGLSGTTYTSSDPGVAVVSPDGLIVGLQEGSSTITASNGSRSAGVAVIVDSFGSDPVVAYDTPGTAHNVAIAGIHAFVADGPEGLQVIDTSPPPAGGIVGALSFVGADALDVQIRGSLAALALDAGGVSLVDISDPFLPAELRRLTGFSAGDLWLSGERLFVAASDGLRVYDIANTGAPILLGTQSFSSDVRAVAGNSATGVAVALTSAPALEVVRVDRGRPSPAATVPLPSAISQADDVAVFGTTIYVANGRTGLHKIDVTDPDNPVIEISSSLNFNALGVAVRQTDQGILVGAADNFFVNAVPLFDENLNHLLNVDFAAFGGVIKRDADSTGIAFGNDFGVVTVGIAGIQVFRTKLLVDNGGVPPVVSIARPVDGSEVVVGSLVRISAVATDDVAVAFVDFLVDGTPVATVGSFPYSTFFPVGPVGTVHTLQVEATDLAGNTSVSLPVTVSASVAVADLLPCVHLRSDRFGSVGWDFGNGLAVDTSDNVVLAGHFGSFAPGAATVNFGGGPLTSAGNTDIYLAKFSAAGTHLWSQRFGGAQADFGVSVAVDAGDNVITIGLLQSSADMGGGLLPPGGYLARYSADGTHLWSRSLGDTTAHADVTVDGSANVVATGTFNGTIDLGGGPLVSGGNSDIFVVKYSSDGAHLWSRRIGAGSNDQGRAVVVDGDGEVIVLGQFAGTVDFGGGPVSTPSNRGIFLAKYAADGSHIWSRGFGAHSGFDLNLAVDGNGDLAITGAYGGGSGDHLILDFGGGPLTSVGFRDIFLAKFSGATGLNIWSRSFGSPGDEFGIGVTMDGRGNVLMTGMFQRTVDFGGGPIPRVGQTNMFLAQYAAADGAHLSSQRFGNFSTTGRSLTVDSGGNLLLTGYFFGNGRLDFGGGPLANSGLGDIFLVRFGPTADPDECTGSP